MEMALAVDPRPGRMPEQDLLKPPKLVGDGGGALYRIWKNPSWVRVFSSGVICKPMGVARGGLQGAQAGGGRGPPLTRGWDPPLGCGSLPGSPFWLWFLISSIKNRRKFASNLENISRSNFLQQFQHKNRELTLGILLIG